VSGALQADEFRHILQVLAENVLIVFGEHRDSASPEFEHLLSAGRIVQYVEGEEDDAFLRKKLFRSKATASAGLGEQDEFIADTFHQRIA